MFKKINIAVLALIGSASAVYPMESAQMSLNTIDDAVLDLNLKHGAQTTYKYTKKVEMLTNVNQQMFLAGYQLNEATPEQLRIVIGKVTTIIRNLEAANEKFTKYRSMYDEVDKAKFNGAQVKVMNFYRKCVADFLAVMQEKIDGKSTALLTKWQTQVATEYSRVNLLKAFRQCADFYKNGYLERVIQGDWDRDLAPNNKNFLARLAVDQVAELSIGTFLTGYAAATSNVDPAETQKSSFAWIQEVGKVILDSLYTFQEKPLETVWSRVQQVPQGGSNRWDNMINMQYNYLKQNFPDFAWVVISFVEKDQCMDMSFAHNWDQSMYQKVQLDANTVMVTLGKGRSQFFKGQGNQCSFRQNIMDGGNYCTTNAKTKEVCLAGQDNPQFASVRTDYFMNVKVIGGHERATRWAWYSNNRVWAVQTSNDKGRQQFRRRQNDQDAVWVNPTPIKPEVFRRGAFLGGRAWYLMWQKKDGKHTVHYNAADFNSIYWQAGGPRVFARVCDEGSKCKYSTLFYKRMNAKEFNPYRLLLNRWSQEHNRFHEDFEIYKSYDDMMRGQNAFQYCNWDFDGVGFPRNCGLTSSTNDWISDVFENNDVKNHSLWMLDF